MFTTISLKLIPTLLARRKNNPLAVAAKKAVAPVDAEAEETGIAAGVIAEEAGTGALVTAGSVRAKSASKPNKVTSLLRL